VQPDIFTVEHELISKWMARGCKIKDTLQCDVTNITALSLQKPACGPDVTIKRNMTLARMSPGEHIPNPSVTQLLNCSLVHNCLVTPVIAFGQEMCGGPMFDYGDITERNLHNIFSGSANRN
jgi:hypothetical protein